MLKSVKARRVKKELTGEADRWTREEVSLNETVSAVTFVVQHHKYTFANAVLVEPTSQTQTNFVSVPIDIGNADLRVGRARQVTREAMTAVDAGTFTIDSDKATFVGRLRQRTWEFRSVVGYDVGAPKELLIAVSNRGKISGIRYDEANDFKVDAAFIAAVERFRGRGSAVEGWAISTRKEVERRCALNDTYLLSVVGDRTAELASLVGPDEAEGFVAGLPCVKLVQVRQLKREITERAALWKRDDDSWHQKLDSVKFVATHNRYTINGAVLVETSSPTGPNFLSAPIELGSLNTRLDPARPVPHATTTAIEKGIFTIDREEATFVGEDQQRKWNYQNVIGYDMGAGNELLIAVSDRSQISGVRCGEALDFRVDAAFTVAVERFRGNADAVKAWAQAALDQLRRDLDDNNKNYGSFLEARGKELSKHIGPEETIAFMNELPGVASFEPSNASKTS
jgi:hypothetical protein